MDVAELEEVRLRGLERTGGELGAVGERARVAFEFLPREAYHVASGSDDGRQAVRRYLALQLGILELLVPGPQRTTGRERDKGGFQAVIGAPEALRPALDRLENGARLVDGGELDPLFGDVDIAHALPLGEPELRFLPEHDLEASAGHAYYRGPDALLSERAGDPRREHQFERLPLRRMA
jgi:hypothetical protein